MSYSSILEAIKEYAKSTPEKLCVGDKKNKATYAQFWEMITLGANYLSNIGVKKGDIVVLKGMQKIEFLFAIFSIQRLGAVACPLEKAVKEDRILEIMDFVETRFFLDNKKLKEESVVNISLKEMFKIVLEKVTSNGLDNISESETDNLVIKNDVKADLNKNVLDNDFSLPKTDDISEILFTTGTTGKSKGIEILYKNNIAIAQNVSTAIGITSEDVELVTAPMNHSMALRRCYSVLYKGGSAIITDGVKFIEDFFKLMDMYKVTGITFAPAILEQLLKFATERFGTYKEQLNYIQLGSAPLSEKAKDTLKEIFPKTRLFNIYGATESGCTVCLDFSKFNDKKGSIGQPNINAKIIFVDDDRNQVKTSKENPGYLAFEGPMNMPGYFKEPEITKEVLDDMGRVYTNDLGYMGDDGFVYLLGRKGDVINMGGIKIAPSEIEEVVAQNEMIKECACIPIPDDITGEAPKLFIVINDGMEYDEKALHRYMLEKLEAIRVPKAVQVIDELPKTFNGKVIKRLLKEMK